MSLLGGSAVPLHRLRIILFDAAALYVRDAKTKLRTGMSLLGGFAPLSVVRVFGTVEELI
jgi:hypothetical protein